MIGDNACDVRSIVPCVVYNFDTPTVPKQEETQSGARRRGPKAFESKIPEKNPVYELESAHCLAYPYWQIIEAVYSYELLGSAV